VQRDHQYRGELGKALSKFRTVDAKVLDFCLTFDGFGYQANYTWINSSAPIPARTVSRPGRPVDQFSKNNASLILLYEKYGFSTRLAATYRDKYIESYYPATTRCRRSTCEADDVSRSRVNYDVTPQLTITAAATNLLNAYYNSYSGNTVFPRDIRTVDRTYQLGFTSVCIEIGADRVCSRRDTSIDSSARFRTAVLLPFPWPAESVETPSMGQGVVLADLKSHPAEEAGYPRLIRLGTREFNGTCSRPSRMPRARPKANLPIYRSTTTATLVPSRSGR